MVSDENVGSYSHQYLDTKGILSTSATLEDALPSEIGPRSRSKRINKTGFINN